MAGRIGTLTSILRKGVAQFPFLFRALRLVWAAAKGWTVGWAVLLVVQGLLPAATVALTKLLVDSLVVVIETTGEQDAILTALVWAVLMGIVMLLNQLFGSATGWVQANQAELVRDYVTSLIHDKSVTVDLAFYESPDYYDHLHRARAEASFRPLSLLESLGALLQSCVTLVAMGAVLIRYGLWLPVALVLSTFPALFVVLRHSRREHRWRMSTTADERRVWYHDWLLTSRQIAAELRLFALGEHFKTRHQDERADLRRQRLRLVKDQMLARLGAGLFGLLVTGGTLAWMVWQALQGLYTLGDLAMFYQAFNQGQGLMRSLLENVGRIYSNSLFLGNLFEFLELEPEIADPAEPRPVPAQLQRGLCFEGVTFCYPGSERPALRDFNLSLPAGSIVAVVGPNGAGKTTLLKLLCRFYDPQGGRIDLDGTDLRALSLEALWGSITVLFQEPVRFQDTVADNIALGDLANKPDLRTIETAAQAAGADSVVATLPDGYDTLLGKWFEGGTDLSVGEWQRIALARAFLRQSSIIALDEPTSAMDPWAEADWLHRFRELARERTALIITHRFTTAMHADIIHVMKDGCIVESGSHQELLALKGLYAQSWRAQMRTGTGTSAEGADPENTYQP